MDVALAAFSIQQFCRMHGISRGLFYALIDRGQAPTLMRVGKRILITTAAAENWRKRMSDLSGRNIEASL
jgi:predicted DNA-binding transcriptional regulator AlpA